MANPDYYKEKRKEEYWSMLKESVRARAQVIFQASGVIGIIIALVTLSGGFFVSSLEVFIVKILLTATLLLIPLSLFLFLYEMNKAALYAQKGIESEINKELSGDKDKNIIDWINVYFPWAFVVFLAIVVIYVCTMIWF